MKAPCTTLAHVLNVKSAEYDWKSLATPALAGAGVGAVGGGVTQLVRRMFQSERDRERNGAPSILNGVLGGGLLGAGAGAGWKHLQNGADKAYSEARRNMSLGVKGMPYRDMVDAAIMPRRAGDEFVNRMGTGPLTPSEMRPPGFSQGEANRLKGEAATKAKAELGFGQQIAAHASRAKNSDPFAEQVTAQMKADQAAAMASEADPFGATEWARMAQREGEAQRELEGFNRQIEAQRTAQIPDSGRDPFEPIPDSPLIARVKGIGDSAGKAVAAGAGAAGDAVGKTVGAVAAPFKAVGAGAEAAGNAIGETARDVKDSVTGAYDKTVAYVKTVNKQLGDAVESVKKDAPRVADELMKSFNEALESRGKAQAEAELRASLERLKKLE